MGLEELNRAAGRNLATELSPAYQQAPVSAAENGTTSIVRNIPYCYSITSFRKDVLDLHGFEGRYNVIYIPHDFRRLLKRKLSNYGYLFVNFQSHEVAVDFMEAIRTKTLSGELKPLSDKSAKKLEVVWADKTQGKNAIIETYRNSGVMRKEVPDECKPMLFENGQQVAFELPTKSLKKPRCLLKEPCDMLLSTDANIRCRTSSSFSDEATTYRDGESGAESDEEDAEEEKNIKHNVQQEAQTECTACAEAPHRLIEGAALEPWPEDEAGMRNMCTAFGKLLVKNTFIVDHPDLHRLPSFALQTRARSLPCGLRAE